MTRRISYLDEAAASDVGREYKRHVLHDLRIEPGHVVLDVGCGPGTDLPAMATAAGPAGKVIGVDHDPAMRDPARKRIRAYPNVEIQAGDAHTLPLDPASVDPGPRRPGAATSGRSGTGGDRTAAGSPPRRPRGLAEPLDTLAIDANDTSISRAYTR